MPWSLAVNPKLPLRQPLYLSMILAIIHTMNVSYTITNQTLNAIYEFSRLHALLYAKNKNHPWIKLLKDLGENRAAYAAVSIDSEEEIDIQTKDVKVPRNLEEHFNNYKFLKNNLSAFFKSEESFGIDSIDKLHSRIMGENQEEHKLEFRNNVKEIKRLINDEGIFKYIKIDVKTNPSEIHSRLTDLANWLKIDYKVVNPILLAAITHYQIVTIHPYTDGNGRLARIFVHGILYMCNIDMEKIIPIEEYFLKYRNNYYDLIDATQETNDLTHWIEFFSRGLLYSIRESAKSLYQISGGTIDIFNDKEISVTATEEKIINLLNKNAHLNGSDIARIMRVSRQNINSILNKMYKKKILHKKGTGSGVRYLLAEKGE